MSEIELIDHSTVDLYRAAASDLDVARAAWVSQDASAASKEAESGRVAGLINFLWRNGHHSPFEHGQFTFVVSTPIFVAREFFRHRTGSYNEISGRYTVLPTRFYIPPPGRPLVQSGKVGSYTFMPGDPDQYERVVRSMKRAYQCAADEYQAMLGDGVAKEVARMVLPVSTMTTFWATMNPRNLMHLLDLRTDSQAQYEIRSVAKDMGDAFAEHMPMTHLAWLGGKEG